MDRSEAVGLALAAVPGVAIGTVVARAISLPAAVSILLLVLGGPALVIWLLVVYTNDRFWATVLAIAVVVRLPYVFLGPVNDDSPVYVGGAADVLAGQVAFSGHIGVELVMAPFVAIFGPAGGNIASFVASLGTIWFTGQTAAILFESERAGYGSGLALALTPVHINFSWWAYTEPIALFVFALSLYHIVSGRYRIALLLFPVVFFMRLEYLLILIPLLILRTDDSRLRYLVVLGPPFAFAGLMAGYALVPKFARAVVSKMLTVRSGLFSTTFLSGFIDAPVIHVAERAQFYFPHLLHWGVPYFEMELVNPVLPVLFLIGLIALLPRLRAVRVVLVGAIIAIIAGFVLREFTVRSGSLVDGHASFIVIGYGLVFLLVVLLLVSSPDPRLQPLVATMPYIPLLAILFLAPRYLLPLFVVFALYAGYGLERVQQTIVWRSSTRSEPQSKAEVT